MPKSLYSTLTKYDMYLIEGAIHLNQNVSEIIKGIMILKGFDSDTDIIMFSDMDMHDMGLKESMIDRSIIKNVEVIDRLGFCTMCVSGNRRE